MRKRRASEISSMASPNWTPLSIDDIWTTVLSFVPLKTIMRKKYFLINKASNLHFRQRFKKRIELRSQLCVLLVEDESNRPAETKSLEGTFDKEDEDDDDEGLNEVVWNVGVVYKEDAAAELVTKEDLPWWIRPGDVVRTTDDDYRNSGKMIWDGEQLIPLDYHSADDYGICPSDFLINDLPSTSYFTKSIDHNYTVWIDLSGFDLVEVVHSFPDSKHLLKIKQRSNGRILFLFCEKTCLDQEEDATLMEAIPDSETIKYLGLDQFGVNEHNTLTDEFY